MNSTYYDGTKLLSLKDINGKQPEIYLCTANRTAGKTTWFSRWAVNRYLKHGEKFCLIYRFNYELDGIADKFFKDINGLFFPGYVMTSERRASGIFHELFIAKVGNDKEDANSCGYAISLNSADQIKKYSHLLSDSTRMIFDEFQSETNHYCENEITKFQSVHTSLARGQGKQAKYLPVYMISNAVTIINPYFVALGISDRLRSDTKFLRGDGFVLENGFVQSAADAVKSSGFARAFSANDKYFAYATQNVYLNDNMAFIDRPTGSAKYVCTLSYNGKNFGVRSYADEGIIYCDDRPDETYKNKIAVTTADHKINYVMLKQNDTFVQQLRFYFERGAFRFKNLLAKECIMKMISY